MLYEQEAVDEDRGFEPSDASMITRRCCPRQEVDNVTRWVGGELLYQFENDPEIDDGGKEFEGVDMKTLRGDVESLLLVFVDMLHIKTQRDEVPASDSPVDGEIRGPSADARIAGVGEDSMGCHPGDKEADIATPYRAIFGLLEIVGHDSQVVLDAVGHPNATALPPPTNCFIGGAHRMVEGHG